MRQAGRIVNVASSAGKAGSRNQSAYNASKHAVVGLTRCLALETATSGVTVNAICPGLTQTDMVDNLKNAFASQAGVSAEQMLQSILTRVPMGGSSTSRRLRVWRSTWALKSQAA